MKPAINQQAALTSNSTQNWTDSSITSDFVGQLFISGSATANDTVSAAAKCGIGATDGTHDYSAAFAIQDASAIPAANLRSVADSISNLGSSGTEIWLASKTAGLSNGITETYTASAASPPLIAGLSFAGTDFELGVATVSFSTTDTAKSITHNCTGTPTVFILVTDFGESGINVGGGAAQTWGFYESAGSTAGALAFAQTTGASPTAAAEVVSSDLGHLITATTDTATLSISGIGASSLTINRTSAASTSCTCILYSFRAKTGTLVAQAGVFTNPTSTGTFTPISGMSGTPQVLFTLATRMTTAGSLVSTDAAGSFSVGIACNNAGTIQQTTAAATTKVAVTTSVAKSQCSINKAMAILDNTGALQFAATVTAFTSTGVTMSCSQNTGSVAAKTAYLAFGIVGGSSGKRLLLLGNSGGF